ncbi:MAG TPA: hypothetical protein VK574_05175 [Terracidiphilus sp.]|jgi:hypothetical protein|nr:hypothetical protein [Terracidiphilus sp.]
MARRTIGMLVLGCVVALSGGLHAAESTKTIIIKVFDGKTGRAVMPTGYQVRVDHETMLHPDWVKQNEDGTAEMTIPADTHELALHLAYNNSMDIYVNCDKEKNAFGDVWYLVPQIMSKGFVTENGCAKAKVSGKFKTTALPGELILFVREKNMIERVKD